MRSTNSVAMVAVSKPPLFSRSSPFKGSLNAHIIYCYYITFIDLSDVNSCFELFWGLFSIALAKIGALAVKCIFSFGFQSIL